MSHTVTVRLEDSLADWLEDTAQRTGRSQGQIIREQLERARSEKQERRFMRLAGCIDGARDLSSRKGFSKG
jgi:predicted transcriptional regulator